jgi:ELWxxDGT repeat protein
LIFVSAFSGCLHGTTTPEPEPEPEVDSYLVKDLSGINWATSLGSFSSLNSNLFFAVGDELWKSDGTEAGTVPVKQSLGAGGSYLGELYRTDNLLYFFVDGYHLWKSDGTEVGTQLVKTFQNDQGFSIIPGTGDNIFIVVSNPGPTQVGSVSLWISDGTDVGTILLKDFVDIYPRGSAMLNMKLLFGADDGTNGNELWESDGTDAGTNLVIDVNPGSESGICYTEFYAMSNQIFFGASDTADGCELWKSDGTNAGTELVKEIYPGAPGMTHEIGHLTGVVVGSEFYFGVNDGTHGYELWKTDGTDAGTTLVVDLNTGTDFGFRTWIMAMNGVVYFDGNDGSSDWHPMWKSDGTAAGTEQVLEAISVSLPIVVGNHLYFLGNFDGNGDCSVGASTADWCGDEILRSDGTSSGTEEFVGLFSKHSSLEPTLLYAVGDMIFIKSTYEDCSLYMVDVSVQS